MKVAPKTQRCSLASFSSFSLEEASLEMNFGISSWQHLQQQQRQQGQLMEMQAIAAAHCMPTNTASHDNAFGSILTFDNQTDGNECPRPSE